jgi:hypothetical protein
MRCIELQEKENVEGDIHYQTVKWEVNGILALIFKERNPHDFEA